MKTVNPNLNRNVKKILSLLLLGCMLLPSFSSCHRKRADPFKTTPSGEAESFEVEKDPFYSMTGAESAQKYGFLVPMAGYQQPFDGKYLYGINTSTDPVTLCKYPVGEWEKRVPVCTDPICDHSEESECPFADFFMYCECCGKTLFYVACKSLSSGFDKIYRYELCRYDERNNKKIVLESLKTGLDYAMRLFERGGKLYYVRRDEKENFEYDETWYEMNEEGLLTKISTVSRHFGIYTTWFYDNRIFVYDSTYMDDGSHYPNGGIVYRLGIYDIETGEERLLHKSGDCKEESGTQVENKSFQCQFLYGNKLLYKATVRIVSSEADAKEIYEDRFYLLNLDTFEEKLVYTGSLEYTNRCLLYNEPRKTESDPFILHIYFPVGDTEEVYNLSEIVGKELRVDIVAGCPEKGAIKLRYRHSGTNYYPYEINLVTKTARYIGQEPET